MTVNVLMSTYNGRQFIQEQINSVLAQHGVKAKITIRDDGSSDGTQEILNKYGDDINWSQGENIGPAQSFMVLLKNAEAADFYAFSDQDDYWQPEKLKVATDFICNEDVPALYFSRTQLTDANLNPTSIIRIDPLLTFGESLVYEFIAGCTIVMNRRLRDIIVQYIPEYVPMHDVWVYSVALAVGAKIHFDKQPHILYRQHGNNTIGQGYGALHEWNRRIKRFVRSEHSRYRRACEIKKGYARYIEKQNADILDTFINAKYNFLKRLSLCCDKRFLCSSKQTWQLFKLSVILNSY